MIIVGVSDLHGKATPAEKFGRHLEDADIVCVSGDITHFGGAREARGVIHALSRYNSDILAVSGNCDYREVDAYLDEAGVNLHARVRITRGFGFVGLGGSLETPFNTPNEYSESELGKFLGRTEKELPPDLPLVLVSHQPPINTVCDRLRNGRHVGSRMLYRFIETYQPLVCFTGHIHEAVGTDRIGKTHIINPGQSGSGRFAYAKIEENRVTVEVRKS